MQFILTLRILTSLESDYMRAASEDEDEPSMAQIYEVGRFECNAVEKSRNQIGYIKELVNGMPSLRSTVIDLSDQDEDFKRQPSMKDLLKMWDFHTVADEDINILLEKAAQSTVAVTPDCKSDSESWVLDIVRNATSILRIISGDKAVELSKEQKNFITSTSQESEGNESDSLDKASSDSSEEV